MWANMLLLTETSEWVSSSSHSLDLLTLSQLHNTEDLGHFITRRFCHFIFSCHWAASGLNMVRSQHRVQVLLYCTWCESSLSLQSPAAAQSADVLILNVSLCSKSNTSLPRVLRNNLPSVKKIWRRVSEMFLIRLNNQLHVLKDDLVNEHLGLITAS